MNMPKLDTEAKLHLEFYDKCYLLDKSSLVHQYGPIVKFIIQQIAIDTMTDGLNIVLTTKAAAQQIQATQHE